MKKLAAIIFVLSIPAPLTFAADWPQWRGPKGNGVSEEKGLPLAWANDRNIAWRAKLEGQGVSSPVVSGDLVIVTSQVGRGDVRPGNHPMLGQRGDSNERPLTAAAGDRVVFLVEAYRRQDGKRVWQYRLPAERTADALPEVHQKTNLANPSPSTDGERVYAWFGTGQMVALDMKGQLVWQKHLALSRGYRSGPYMAISPGGRGDIAGTPNVVWHVGTGAPYVSSVVHYNGVVYMASDAGILQAADAKTGARLFQGRTGNLYSAAPIAGDGKVYFVSENGETVVLKASREFEILSRNQLAGRFMASPVIAHGLFILRSDDELIAVASGPAHSASPAIN